MRRADAPGRTGGLPLLAGFALLSLALRAHDLGNPVLATDEQYYLLVGERWLRGARLYAELWDRKPPGLFAIYALAAALPGDGVLAYQLLAALCAAGTAFLVARIAGVAGGRAPAAAGAGAAYLLWAELLGGRGGQSPVFYNLPMAAAALLVLRLPPLARAGRRGAIARSGAAACLLAGLAIQVKYTAVVEGVFFGAAHLWHLRRAGARAAALAAAAIGWAVLGALPTLAVMAWFRWHDPAGFGAFWFANFVSVTLRRGFPAARIAGRLAGIAAILLPLALPAGLALRRIRRGGEPWPQRRLLAGWLGAAGVAFAMIGAFFDHYALPLLPPLAVLAVLGLEPGPLARGRHRGLPRGAAVAACGLLLFGWKLWVNPDERASARAVAAVMARAGPGCPYVFTGDAALYRMAGACLPTAYAFPSTLAYDADRGATGVDEAREVARILAARPPVVVTLDRPEGVWNARSHAEVAAALARAYRPVLSVPRDGRRMVAWARLATARVTSGSGRPAAPSAGAAASPRCGSPARTGCRTRTGWRARP